MLYRLVLAKWIQEREDWDRRKLPDAFERELTPDELLEYNLKGYNCYWLPNSPSIIPTDRAVDGTDIVNFNYVYADLDLKDYMSENKDRAHSYKTKEDFLLKLASFPLEPTMVVDSGNGIHAYWAVSDLDAMSFLRIQRRIARLLKTDPAVAKIYQLMRVWDTLNTKEEGNYKLCKIIEESDVIYTAEDLDKALPRITDKDEQYCKGHFEKTYDLGEKIDFKDELPARWATDFPPGSKGYNLMYGPQKDRSIADYKLGYQLHAKGYSKEDAVSVLARTDKASERYGVHRYNYAESIVKKIWDEKQPPPAPTIQARSRSVKDILSANPDAERLKGTRFPCHPVVDNTFAGFRLGHVMGLIAGSGVGKTAFAMNLFYWFIERNPEYIHLFVSLEQPEAEIADRWRIMTAANNNPNLDEYVHIMGNYSQDGVYINVGLKDIEERIKSLEAETGRKVGAVVIDHIGILKAEKGSSDTSGLEKNCEEMKSLAVRTNTFIIMQSQSSRAKAGSGDVELDKDAAFGTSKFENYCDWLVTIWQPLKRVYHLAENMTITIFKYCKIRHKKLKRDNIKEDVPYPLMFDPETETMRLLKEHEIRAYEHLIIQATNARKLDTKKESRALGDINWIPRPMDKNGKETG